MSFFSLRHWHRPVTVALSLAWLTPIPVHSEGAARPAWELFPAGALPKGITLTEGEVATLADGAPNERTYLVGQFIVTASAAKRAIFRSGPGSLIRIVVDYPADFNAPPENAVAARDDAHPLLITNIRHGNDGQITVYTREVVQR